LGSLNSIVRGHITLMAIRVLDYCYLAVTFWMSIVARQISPANPLTPATSPATSVWSQVLKLISGQNKACATRHAMIGNVTVPRKNKDYESQSFSQGVLTKTDSASTYTESGCAGAT
jgi:hypothetical protein